MNSTTGNDPWASAVGGWGPTVDGPTQPDATSANEGANERGTDQPNRPETPEWSPSDDADDDATFDIRSDLAASPVPTRAAPTPTFLTAMDRAARLNHLSSNMQCSDVQGEVSSGYDFYQGGGRRLGSGRGRNPDLSYLVARGIHPTSAAPNYIHSNPWARSARHNYMQGSNTGGENEDESQNYSSGWGRRLGSANSRQVARQIAAAPSFSEFDAQTRVVELRQIRERRELAAEAIARRKQ